MPDTQGVIERPIIFSARMVEAILAGRKTVTRRIITPRKSYDWAVGDVMWVRERWQVAWPCEAGVMIEYLDGTTRLAMSDSRSFNAWMRRMVVDYQSRTKHKMQYGKPSIHMPRWASRITLPITSIRSEPLQDITEYEAIREGFESIEDFRELWDKLNEKRGGGWDANPLVRCIEWQRIHKLEEK